MRPGATSLVAPVVLGLGFALIAGCGAEPPKAGPVAATPSTGSSVGSVATFSATPAPPATTSSTTSETQPTTAAPSTRAAAAATTAVAPRTPSAEPAALPVFHASAAAITTAELGATHHAGCPTPAVDLRELTLSYVDFGGHAQTGHLVVNATQVVSAEAIFARLYAERFPIRRMVPVSAYGGSDERSVSADNTAGFNCRAAVTAGGTPSWSMHAYGEAIDVDPVENPYLYGGTVDPADGAAYVDRADHRPGIAYAGGELVDAFAAVGWKWGATFGDYQHFSTNGR